MTKTRPGKTFIILLLGALIAISPFAIDMYLPAFSQIAKDFGTTPALVSFSVASYFIGLAFGQLLYGPLLDRFGRIKPLYYGLTIFILACVGCMQSQTVEALVVFRFIQAIGGCVAWVAATAMVRDFFPVEESAKIFSLLVLVLGVSPLLAPTIGGFITEALGWKWVFIALAIIVLLILIVVAIYLPEVHKPDPSVSLKPKPMLLTFCSILINPQFFTYTLAGAFSFSNMFIYVAGSPVIFMELYQVSPQAYGGIFALLSIGFIGGNQLNILLLRRYKSEQIFGVALIFQLIIAVVFLIGAYNNWFGLYSTIGMFFLILSSLGLTYPNSSALALAPFTKNIGSASALLGATQIGVAAVVSSSVGFFNATSSIPITVMLATSASIAFILLLIGRSIIQRKLELA